MAGAGAGSRCGGERSAGVSLAFRRALSLSLASPHPPSPPAGTGDGRFLVLQVRVVPSSWALASERDSRQRPGFRTSSGLLRGSAEWRAAHSHRRTRGGRLVQPVACEPAAAGVAVAPWRGQAARGGAGRAACREGPVGC